MKKKLFEEGWLSPVLMKEIVICDSELSQLSFSTISAHSMNVQPSSKDKNAPRLWSRKRLRQKSYPGPEGITFG